MLDSQSVMIRKFNKPDREGLREIAYDTAFMGEPAAAFFDGKEVLSDALTGYFTDYEPQACFVAEAEGKIAGYLIGTKDKAVSEKIFSQKILPGLFWKALTSGVFFRKKNMEFIFRVLSSMISGEFRMPDFSREYPATLHINIKQGYRGLNIGSQLIAKYLDYLRAQGVKGVFLATMSKGAGDFFLKQGFILIFSGRRSYFRHILCRDVPLLVYAKSL